MCTVEEWHKRSILVIVAGITKLARDEYWDSEYQRVKRMDSSGLWTVAKAIALRSTNLTKSQEIQKIFGQCAGKCPMIGALMQTRPTMETSLAAEGYELALEHRDAESDSEWTDEEEEEWQSATSGVEEPPELRLPNEESKEYPEEKI